MTHWRSAGFFLGLFLVSGYDGIGRHARFRFWCASVQVQVLSSAVTKKVPGRVPFLLLQMTDDKNMCHRRWLAAHCPKGMCGIVLVQNDLFNSPVIRFAPVGAKPRSPRTSCALSSAVIKRGYPNGCPLFMERNMKKIVFKQVIFQAHLRRPPIQHPGVTAEWKQVLPA